MTQRLTFTIFFILNGLLAIGQSQNAVNDSTFILKGTVLNEYQLSDFGSLYVINKRQGRGNFSNGNGSFQINAKLNDTLVFGAIGYKTKFVPVTDSLLSQKESITIQMMPLSFNLKEVVVVAPRDLDDIYNEIDDLHYDERDYMINGVDALASPITALYASISRKEKQKRLAYELMNEAKRRKLLKELLQKYVAYDIIQLDEQEFDNFLDFCYIDDATLQNLTQYEFIMFVKKKFELYRSLNPNEFYWDNEPLVKPE